jgi:hypothetical protein
MMKNKSLYINKDNHGLTNQKAEKQPFLFLFCLQLAMAVVKESIMTKIYTMIMNESLYINKDNHGLTYSAIATL